MFWAFSKMPIHAYLLAYFLACLAICPAFAETGTVSAVGTGRDTPEAIANLLKSTVARYFKSQPAPLSRSVLQSEILPNASSFVQSYKIIEAGRPGSVNLSASVDLDVINGLMNLTPKNIGEDEGAKALVLVRGPKIPDNLLPTLKPGAAAPDPFASLLTSARERFARRNFAEANLTGVDMQAVGAGEDFASPELLRGLGSKAGARIALGIMGRFETYENENSHNRDERLVLAATMVDVKAGNVIGRTVVNVVGPKSRRDQYVADLQRNIMEESKDLFQDIFVAAGRKLVKSEGQSSFTVVRVLQAPNSFLVVKFKALLEAVSGVRSVTELSVRRGKYDFAVHPALAEAVLAKAVAAIQSPDLSLAVLQGDPSDPSPAALYVKLSPKETGTVAPAEELAPNAKH